MLPAIPAMVAATRGSRLRRTRRGLATGGGGGGSRLQRRRGGFAGEATAVSPRDGWPGGGSWLRRRRGGERERPGRRQGRGGGCVSVSCSCGAAASAAAAGRRQRELVGRAGRTELLFLSDLDFDLILI
jgi:hypothetical protein